MHWKTFTLPIVLAAASMAVACNSGTVSETDPDPAGGCPGTVYPDWKTSPYVLPTQVGQSVKIDLSNCSGSYHSLGEPDAFAIDFQMSIGTRVTATRGGIVAYVQESGTDGGFPNNLVVVNHRDGTYGQYMHLTHDGAAVTVGTEVTTGELIGYSGSTGLAGYPHLHFVVTRGGFGYPYESVPVTFRNTLPNPNSLISGKIYTAKGY